MQSANEIRRHIAAVSETRKITNAMELISAARLKKVMSHIDYNTRYLGRVRSAMKDILVSPHPIDHPYLNRDMGKKRLYIVIAGDKGMVGSYNNDILNLAWKEMSGCEDYILITVGIIAAEFFRMHGRDPDYIMSGLSQDPSLINARILMDDIIEKYDSHEARSAYVIYTQFNPGAPSQPVVQRVLPIRISDYNDVAASCPGHEIIYVPSANEVFSQLIPQYLVGILFGALVQSYASEHFARRGAMKSATDNADELLSELTLQYNTARQTAITQEIAEISGAAVVLKDGSL